MARIPDILLLLISVSYIPLSPYSLIYTALCILLASFDQALRKTDACLNYHSRSNSNQIQVCIKVLVHYLMVNLF